MNTSLRFMARKIKRALYAPNRVIHRIDAAKKKEKICREKREKQRTVIKIGFIVQMPEVWDKEAPLFEALLKDERFIACLIIVPHYDFANSKLGQYGEEKKYFIEKYPDANIVLLNGTEDMVVNESYDYIFYQRCWESYLPKQLRCRSVINYALTAYIPYCYHFVPMAPDYYRKDFFWYLNRFYCCNTDQYKEAMATDNIECCDLGYPVIDAIHYPERGEKPTNVLWTPRWSDDPIYGGTSFNRNRDKILDLLSVSDDISLIIRPHPLTFENAVKVGWMSASDVKDYKEKAVRRGAFFDNNKLIEETFLCTDILITDFSTSIITFFLSGRPIIYSSETNYQMTDIFKKILDSVYIAKDYDDICRITQELLNGNDPKRGMRYSVIEKIRQEKTSVDNIITDLYEFLTLNKEK